MNNIRIFSIPDCSYCVRAKELLLSKGIPYSEISLMSEEAVEELTREIPNVHLSAPQVFEGSRHVGGYTELAKEVEEGTIF